MIKISKKRIETEKDGKTSVQEEKMRARKRERKEATERQRGRQKPGVEDVGERRKEKFGMLQRADSLLWCREPVANENHTHPCTHGITHNMHVQDCDLVQMFASSHSCKLTDASHRLPITVHHVSFDF